MVASAIDHQRTVNKQYCLLCLQPAVRDALPSGVLEDVQNSTASTKTRPRSTVLKETGLAANKIQKHEIPLTQHSVK